MHVRFTVILKRVCNIQENDGRTESDPTLCFFVGGVGKGWRLISPPLLTHTVVTQVTTQQYFASNCASRTQVVTFVVVRSEDRGN
jgi:hypothetical protein